MTKVFIGKGRIEILEKVSCSYPCTGLNRPLGVREFEVSRISGQPSHGGGKVVSQSGKVR